MKFKWQAAGAANLNCGAALQRGASARKPNTMMRHKEVPYRVHRSDSVRVKKYDPLPFTIRGSESGYGSTEYEVSLNSNPYDVLKYSLDYGDAVRWVKHIKKELLEWDQKRAAKDALREQIGRNRRDALLRLEEALEKEKASKRKYSETAQVGEECSKVEPSIDFSMGNVYTKSWITSFDMTYGVYLNNLLNNVSSHDT